MNDTNFIEKILLKEPLTLEYLPYKYQNDFKLVMSSVKKNGDSILYASEDLRKNSLIAT